MNKSIAFPCIVCRLNVEDYHEAIKCDGILTLKEESNLVDATDRLLCNNKLRRAQRKKYRDLQAKIFKNWEKFEDGDIDIFQLLRKCSVLNAP